MNIIYLLTFVTTSEITIAAVSNDVSLPLPAFLDVIICLILFWAIYRGYMRGAIVHSVALLVLFVAIGISVKLSYSIYEYLQDKARITLYNLPVILFSVFAVFSVIGTHFVTNKVIKSVGETVKGKKINQGIGVGLNVLKYLFLISIASIIIFKLDANFAIINEKEKEKTSLFYPILNIAPTVFSTLRFNEIHPVPSGRPEKIKRETDEETDIN